MHALLLDVSDQQRVAVVRADESQLPHCVTPSRVVTVAIGLRKTVVLLNFLLSLSLS